LDFDGLVLDGAAVMLIPISNSPLSGISLNKRLPSGQTEKIQKAIQDFLIIRDLKFSLLKKTDHYLNILLKQPSNYLPSHLKPGQNLRILREKHLFIPCVQEKDKKKM
jgi:hypothetical protein